MGYAGTSAIMAPSSDLGTTDLRISSPTTSPPENQVHASMAPTFTARQKSVRYHGKAPDCAVARILQLVQVELRCVARGVNYARVSRGAPKHIFAEKRVGWPGSKCTANEGEAGDTCARTVVVQPLASSAHVAVLVIGCDRVPYRAIRAPTSL